MCVFFQAHEALLDSKTLFEEINNELHKELPKFYDYRIEFLAGNLLRLYEAESTFHTNAGKVCYTVSVLQLAGRPGLSIV